VGIPVRTVAAGGMPVIDVTATTPKLGIPVTEATYGIPVTKVTPGVGPQPRVGGVPVTYVAATLQVLEGGSGRQESQASRSRAR
jgi:hypothetical protein